MNEEILLSLCERLNTDDIMDVKEARRQLKDVLSPLNIYNALQLEKSKLSQLFSQAQSSRSVEVNRIVCEALSALWQDESLGLCSYEEDADGLMCRYVVEAIVSDSISIAAMARRPLLDALLLNERAACSSGQDCRRISTALNDLVQGEKVLRLFDCDTIESESNALVYQCLKNNTSIVQEIIRLTVSAFDDDPLLLANFLVLCGILSRIDQELLRTDLAPRIHQALLNPGDELTWTAVSQFCYCALWHCDAIAKTHFADDWIAAAAAAVCIQGVSEEIVSCGISIACAGCSTSSGWTTAIKYFSSDIICSLLRSKNNTKVLAGLNFLSCVFQSAFCTPNVLHFSESVLEAWSFRLSLEEPIRVQLWIAVLAMSRHAPFTLRDACVSYLSTTTVHEVASVREKQLQVAESLLCIEDLPLVSKEGIQRFIRAGLHPPGSSGVAALPG